MGPEIHTASLRGGYGPTSGRSLQDVRQHDRENVQDRDREGDRRDQCGGVDERLCVRIQVHPIPLPEPCHPEGVRGNPSFEGLSRLTARVRDLRNRLDEQLGDHRPRRGNERDARSPGAG